MENQKHKGLGDTIASITKQTGIDKVAKFVAEKSGKKDCGCSRRQERLNKMFPYKK